MSTHDDDGFPLPMGLGGQQADFTPSGTPDVEPSNVSDHGGVPVNLGIEATSLGFNSGLVGSGESVCDSCLHCWDIRKTAEVANLDANGDPFLAKEKFCAVMPQSLFTLNDRVVKECNKYTAGGVPRVTLKDVKNESSD